METDIINTLDQVVQKNGDLAFYKKKWDAAGITPSSVKSVDDFRKIPFTTSDEIYSELLKKPSECGLCSKNVTRMNFSPSGKLLYPIYHTQNDLVNMHKVCARTLKDAGVKKDDICAITFGYHLFVAGLFYQGQLEAYGAKVIPLGPGESERAVKIINDYNVSVLIGNPSFAMKLAKAKIPSVKILFVGGEAFTAVDGYKEKVKQAFSNDITIIDSYSMALCLPIARSCQHDNGLHIMDEFVYAEIIDPVSGEVLPPGTKGELVLTHLNKEASPLIRYRTGDLTIMEEKECACGRKLTLPKSILGRTDEMLKIKGVKFWPSQIGMILKSFPSLAGRHSIIVSSKNKTDHLELLIESQSDQKKDIDALLEKIKRDTLISFDKISMVEKIEGKIGVVDKR